MKTSRYFYQHLPETDSIIDVFDVEASALVPSDWTLIITDVVQSTQAIEAGQYRNVNTAGGLTVMAIANLLNSLEFPFVFGGDGVTMLVPNDLVSAARDVLVDARAKIRSVFNLKMRVGIVPMQVLQDQGYQLRVSKLRISPYYAQAIFDGEGLDVAESWVKSPAMDNPFLVVSKRRVQEADFNGFTCRWQDVLSEKGEVVSLIVKFRAKDALTRKKELSAFLTVLTRYYGTEQDYHPIQVKQMRAGRFQALRREIKIRAVGRPRIKRWKLAFELSLQIGFVRLIQFLHIPVRLLWMDLLHLDELNAISSDFRKFDGALKMVISGTENSRKQLTNYLETGYQAGRLYYGLHISNRAVLTCLMHVASSNEVHFVDGAEGGYTIAAKQLKHQLLAK